MADLPLMPKATAVWLVDNTTLTFEQISDFTGLHPLEIEGIADGEVAQGMKGVDPVLMGQIARGELERCQADPKARLKLMKKAQTLAPEPKRKGPRYTPLSKRQDKPAAIAWLVKYHPELPDSAIVKLVGTTKPTIAAVRDRSHWNMANITPVDPVALGLCRQTELDEHVRKAAAKKDEDGAGMSDEDKMKLMSLDQSLNAPDPEPRLPSSMAGLENFSLGALAGGEEEPQPGAERPGHDPLDPDALFNLPDEAEAEEEDDLDPRR